LALLCTCVALGAWGEPLAPVAKAAAEQKAPFLETLKELTAIESGSRDIEGLDRIGAVIAKRLKDLGGDVEVLPAAEITRLEDTPDVIGKAVKATFRGKGTKKILLIAHMDTVYAKGMGAQQPFRIDGDKAYGLGIA